MHSRYLLTLLCPEEHINDNLVKTIKGALDAWDLREVEQSYLNSDNGSNIKRAVSDLNSPISLALAIIYTNINAIKDVKRVYAGIEDLLGPGGDIFHSWKKAQMDLNLP